MTAANTFNDAVHDVRVLLKRLERHSEIVCGRQRSIEVALAMDKQGTLTTWWEGDLLIARRRATFLKPDPIAGGWGPVA